MTTWADPLATNSTANIATAFRTRTPLLPPGDDPSLIGTTVELPKAIKSAIKNGLDKVGTDCIRGNAEILFGWFEECIVESVVQ